MPEDPPTPKRFAVPQMGGTVHDWLNTGLATFLLAWCMTHLHFA